MKEARMSKSALISLAAVIACMAALEPPYLSTVTALDEMTVNLTWRASPSSFNLCGVFYRKAGDPEFLLHEYVERGVTATIVEQLEPLNKYYFALKIYTYNGMYSVTQQPTPADSSSFSNIDSIDLPPIPAILKSPGITVVRDTATSEYSFVMYDSSTIESGHLLRLTNLKTAAVIETLIVPRYPGFRSRSTLLSIPQLETNQWYEFTLAAVAGSETLSTEPDTMVTLDATETFKDVKRIYLQNRIGSLALDYNGFAVKFGDSLIVRRRSRSDSTGNIVNISNPESPNFEGTTWIPPWSAPNGWECPEIFCIRYNPESNELIGPPSDIGRNKQSNHCMTFGPCKLQSRILVARTTCNTTMCDSPEEVVVDYNVPDSMPPFYIRQWSNLYIWGFDTVDLVNGHLLMTDVAPFQKSFIDTVKKDMFFVTNDSLLVYEFDYTPPDEVKFPEGKAKSPGYARICRYGDIVKIMGYPRCKWVRAFDACGREMKVNALYGQGGTMIVDLKRAERGFVCLRAAFENGSSETIKILKSTR
jgi:hypothetical protein